MQRTIKIFFFIVLSFLLYFFQEKRTDGFRTSKIFFKEITIPWKSKDLSFEKNKKIEKILSQKFRYLSRGRQCYVFESLDKKYVIKFLNNSNILYPNVLKHFSFLKFVERSLKRKDKKFFITFQSLLLSYEHLKKEACIIYFNINRKKVFKDNLLVVSKYKQPFLIDLNKTFFVIQKKMDPFYPVLEKFYKKEKKAEFEEKLNEFLDLIFSRSLKLIADDDLNVEKNYGVKNGKVKILDTGRLFINKRLKESYFLEKELLKSTKFLRVWINKNFPSYSEYLDKKIKDKMKEYFEKK